MRIIVFSLFFMFSLAGFAAGDVRGGEATPLPDCPAELAFHCEVLENAWIQPLETIIVIGSYVCKRSDPNFTAAESVHFFAAVKAYLDAERQLRDNPGDLDTIKRFDTVGMDLKLAAKALRLIVGKLQV